MTAQSKLSYASDEPQRASSVISITAEQRGRELNMLDGTAAVLDVTAAAAKGIGKDGTAATLANSVAKVSLIARDMIDLIRAEMAQQGRDPDADEVLGQVEQAAACASSFWNRSS